MRGRGHSPGALTVCPSSSSSALHFAATGAAALTVLARSVKGLPALIWGLARQHPAWPWARLDLGEYRLRPPAVAVVAV